MALHSRQLLEHVLQLVPLKTYPLRQLVQLLEALKQLRHPAPQLLQAVPEPLTYMPLWHSIHFEAVSQRRQPVTVHFTQAPVLNW